MNANNKACASSTDVTPWNQIDWEKVEADVRRLQARIVKATKEGKPVIAYGPGMVGVPCGYG